MKKKSAALPVFPVFPVFPDRHRASTLKAWGIIACGLAHRTTALHTILRSGGAREKSDLHDAVAVAQAFLSVGDHEDGGFAVEVAESVDKCVFGFAVQRTGGFVQNKERRIPVEGTGNGNLYYSRT